MNDLRTRVTALFLLIVAVSFCGYALSPVEEDDWGLKIVIFDVGQADAVLLLTPDGETALIDIGKTTAHGKKISKYLSDEECNKVASIDTLNFLFCSHYDQDHIGGAGGLNGISVLAAYDQGPSMKRDVGKKSSYGKYVALLGDPNGNGRRDSGESAFVRHQAEPGDEFTLGEAQKAHIRVLSVRGDTLGDENDLPLSPAEENIDENAGSLIQLVTLNDFEYLSMGDASSGDWKSEPDTEEAIISADAIPNGPDIDVLKVGHHGSDTSSGLTFVEHVLSEVAVISSDRTKDELPKLTSIKALEENGAKVLVTGRAKNQQGKFHQSDNNYDDGYKPVSLEDKVGTITILVAQDGSKYTIRCEKKPSLAITKSSQDAP